MKEFLDKIEKKFENQKLAGVKDDSDSEEEKEKQKQKQRQKKNKDKELSEPAKNQKEKVLAGLTVALTGKLPTNKHLLTEKLKANGAIVSNLLHKGVTCLLSTKDALKESTQKVRKAKKFGIEIVEEAFITDSLKKGKLATMEDYIIQT